MVTDTVAEAFNAGKDTPHVGRPTKMEQRFRPGTAGNTLYHRQRYLSAAERQGLIPIRGDYRKYPVK